MSELTGTDGETVSEHLADFIARADSERAITKTIGEVLVKAKATNIIRVAAQLVGLAASHHVIGAGLLEKCISGALMIYRTIMRGTRLTPQEGRLSRSWARTAEAMAVRANTEVFILVA